MRGPNEEPWVLIKQVPTYKLTGSLGMKLDQECNYIYCMDCKQVC
jgi:hypothetical protein